MKRVIIFFYTFSSCLVFLSCNNASSHNSGILMGGKQFKVNIKDSLLSSPKKSIKELTQSMIKVRSIKNNCYLPLLNDSSLYPNDKRSFFNLEELYNQTLDSMSNYRNRFLVGNFMVLDSNMKNKGITEKNPDLGKLEDFKDYEIKLLTLLNEATDDLNKGDSNLMVYLQDNYSKDKDIIYNFFDKVWRYKTPGLKREYGILNKKAYALGQTICLCELKKDTIELIAEFAVSSKRLTTTHTRDSNDKVKITGYIPNLPIGKYRNYYGAQYTITSKNWETRRKYTELDQLHDTKLGGGNDRVTFFKTGAQLPNFLLMSPTEEFPKAMEQNGIHEVALRGVSRGMLGSSNSIGCVRVSDFASKFLRWWAPNNANFFILYDQNRYYSELRLDSIANLLPFKNEIEGNEFRKWLNENKPLRAKQLQIDLEGKHDNGFILDAYNLYGNDYENVKQ